MSFIMRLPAPELIERYQAAGLWSDNSLSRILDEGLLCNPDQRFRIWSDQRPYDGTFQDVRDRARRIAAGFRSLGIGTGDVVSFQLPNYIEAVETFLATLYVGAVCLPIVHIYGSKEVEFILAQSRSKLHVTVRQFRNLNYRSMLAGMTDRLPALTRVIYADEDFGALRSMQPLPGPVVVAPDSPALIGYTSGTTADPKGVIHTHRTYVAEMLQRNTCEPGDERPVPLMPPKGSDHWLVGAPVGHVAGLQSGVIVPILFNTPANLTDHWEIDFVLRTLGSEELSLGASPNFFFASVISHPDFDPAVHVPRLRHILSGGAPIPRAFGEQCDAMGMNLVRGYGSTEHPSVSGSAFADPLEKRIGTDGRALAGVDIRIVDASDHAVAIGVAGEIQTRGPDLFVGYVDDRLNDSSFTVDGWFRTGDIGFVDEDGYLTICDRSKDIIIRGGENISAAEVEDALLRMEEVLEVAAVAAPDTRLGEHVCAFIRVAPGRTAPTMESMRTHLATLGLARQKWPEELRIAEDFDRTPAGKVKKFVLRDLLRADAG